MDISAIQEMPPLLDIYLFYTEFTGFTMSLFTAILYRIYRVLSIKSNPYISAVLPRALKTAGA